MVLWYYSIILLVTMYTKHIERLGVKLDGHVPIQARPWLCHCYSKKFYRINNFLIIMVQDFTVRRKISCKRCKSSSNTCKSCNMCKACKKSCKTCKSCKNLCKTCKSYLQEINRFLARSCNKADTFIARLARLSKFLQEIQSLRAR